MAAIQEIESSLDVALETAPAALHADLAAARQASTSEFVAVEMFTPGLNVSQTPTAVAGCLSTIHHQTAIGSTSLSEAAKSIRRRCAGFVGTLLAQQIAVNAAILARDDAAAYPPSPSAVLTATSQFRALQWHLLTVLSMTPAGGPVTRVKYGVVIIYRTDIVCVAFPSSKVPKAPTC
ncbi:MAG TPA: hypothetical protein VND83_10120 [Acidimicrobiales bacterium]|nr:hypothetical protein [Acidimicrobiales bacterium]